MSIKILTVVYPNNPVATFWSRLKGFLECLSFFIIFMLIMQGAPQIKNGFLVFLWVIASVGAGIVYAILVNEYCDGMIAKALKKDQRQKRKPALGVAALLLSLFIGADGGWWLYQAHVIQEPEQLSMISGSELKKGQYYCGELLVIQGLGQLRTRGVPSSDFYLAVFKDKDEVWNYCILEPSYRKSIEDGRYSGCFCASGYNDTITGWKEEAIAQDDAVLFGDSAIKRAETDYGLDYRFDTAEEYMAEQENDKWLNILAALFVIAFGCVCLYMGWAVYRMPY